MNRLRSVLVSMLTLLVLAFPVQAQANIFGDLWDDIKDAVSETLDAGEGVLEVGWEGIYGAGCGVKNLATWDGTSCKTSVADSGDKARNLMRDVDECASSFDPTGISGLGTSGTTSDPDQPVGMSEDEVKQILSTASTEGAAATSAMSAYLESAGGVAAIAKNPVWGEVARGLPYVKYVLIAVSIAENCGKTFDFLDAGVPFLLGTHGTQWRIRDGKWYECEITCKLSAELNYPGCDPIFLGGGDRPVEVICRPGTGYQEPVTPDDALKKTVCGEVMTDSSKPFDYDAYCRDKLDQARQDCRNGTSRYPASICTQLVGSSGPTTVQTAPSTANGAAPNPNGLDAQGVPGGSVAGSCATIIKQIAAGGAGAPATSATIANCLGTADPTCQPLRAKAAAGYNVFPLPNDLQARCFG